MNNLVVVHPVKDSDSHLTMINHLLSECYGKVLNIGDNIVEGDNVINFDIGKMLDSGVSFPYVDDEFDLCICINVLEHTFEFKTIIDNITRVLKPSGLLYIELPLLEPYNASNDSLIRITPSGIIKLLKEFDIQELEIINGPGSTMHWLSRIYYALYFDRYGTYNDLMTKSGDTNFIEGFNIFGMSHESIKDTDEDLNLKEHAILIASSYYVIARKL